MCSGPAFLFPGQGGESVGMGVALMAADERRFGLWIKRAEAASGLPIRDAVLAGPAATLAATDVAQPALLATSLAIAEWAHAIGLTPRFVAGHGLGEYTAAVVAGVLDPDDAMRLVAARGRFMAAAEREQPGAMAFVLGLPLADVEFICSSVRQRHGYVTLAYANSPQQAVVSGNASSVAAALERAQRHGATGRMTAARGAHHSLLMATVQARVARVAKTMTWRDGHTPLISATDGRILVSGAEIRAALIGRETRPVQWTLATRAMLAAGCQHFLELGPGRALAALTRHHARQVVAATADGPAGLAAFRKRLAASGAGGASVPANRIAI